MYPFHTQVSRLNTFKSIGGPTYTTGNNSPIVWLGHLAISEKQYRENLYQVLLSLSKALCKCSIEANFLATIPKQNVFMLSVAQHIYMCIEISQIIVYAQSMQSYTPLISPNKTVYLLWQLRHM